MSVLCSPGAPQTCLWSVNLIIRSTNSVVARGGSSKSGYERSDALRGLIHRAARLRRPSTVSEIRHNACDELDNIDQAAVLTDFSASLDEAGKLKGFSLNLIWSHYRSLSRVGHRAEIAREEVAIDAARRLETQE